MTSRAQEFPDSQFRSGRCGEINSENGMRIRCVHLQILQIKHPCKQVLTYWEDTATKIYETVTQMQLYGSNTCATKTEVPSIEDTARNDGLGRPTDTHLKKMV